MICEPQTNLQLVVDLRCFLSAFNFFCGICRRGDNRDLFLSQHGDQRLGAHPVHYQLHQAL